jgi:hypothetical protein
MKSFTNQYIHQTKAAADFSNGRSAGLGGHMSKGNVGVPSETVADYTNKMLSMNQEILESGGDKQSVINMNRIFASTAKNTLSPEDYKAFKRHHIDYFKGHEEFGALVNYMTTNTYQPSYLMQDDFDWGEVFTSAGSVAAVGAPFAWLGPLEWGAVGIAALATGVGNAGMQLLDMTFDNSGNVRDIMRPQGEGWDPNDPDKGWDSFLGIWDSEAAQLEDNLEAVDEINKLLGTNYKNGEPEYEQLKKNALSLLRFNQHHGGDEMNDAIDNYQGDVFEAETFIPDLSNTKTTNAIKTLEENFDPRDWNIMGVPEDSPAWDKMFTDKSGNPIKPGDATMKFQGVITPSIEDNTPLMFKWNINGELYLAESKDNTSSGFVLEERIAQMIDKSDLIVIDRSRQMLNAIEDGGQGEGEFGGASINQLYGVLTRMYSAVMGLSEPDAAMYAEGYIVESFEKQNYKLINAIAQKYGADNMQSVRETNEYKSVFNMYMQSEVRGY